MPVEGDKIFTRDVKYERLFSDLVKNLKISKFKEVNSYVEEISHPILKAILKT